MEKPTPPAKRIIKEDVDINWTKVRTVCAWILFGLGCIPAIPIVAIAAVLVVIAIACVSPGMLLAPGQKLGCTYTSEEYGKGTWNWGKLINKADRTEGIDHD
jgi:hypothetical protein